VQPIQKKAQKRITMHSRNSWQQHAVHVIPTLCNVSYILALIQISIGDWILTVHRKGNTEFGTIGSILPQHSISFLC